MQKPSPFGLAVRKLRLGHNERQSDLAKAIGISVSFLSAIELGKSNAPESLIRDVIARYELDENAANDLWRLAEISRREVCIDLRKLPDHSRELAHSFAGRISRLSPEQVRAVREIICQV